MEPIRVGIIGVTPGQDYKTGGWANIAHLPALQALPYYEIKALSSRTRRSAEHTAEKFGVSYVFSTSSELIQCSEIDLVVITVKVPDHFKLVTEAIEAGKHVHCEWPLANGLAEAQQLVEVANRQGLRCGVGLQGRGSPAIRYVRDLIAKEAIGQVLSSSMIGSGMNWGPGMPERNAYTLDKTQGATLLSIAGGHALDAHAYCLGEFETLTATSGLLRKTVYFPLEDKVHTASAEDQWAISGTLQSGAIASVHYRGGIVSGNNFYWEINGTQGDLRLSCDFGNLQVFQLKLEAAFDGSPLAPLEIPSHYYLAPRLEDPVFNVAQIYALYAQDRHNGTNECPDFNNALLRHQMLDAIERSARHGTRERYIAI